MFEVGVAGFALRLVLCGLSPSVLTLALARALQGVAAALLVPVSLSLVRADIDETDQGDRPRPVDGLSGVTSALGPLVGGWLVKGGQLASHLFLNLPLAVGAAWVAHRCVPDEAQTTRRSHWTFPAPQPGCWRSGDYLRPHRGPGAWLERRVARGGGAGRGGVLRLPPARATAGGDDAARALPPPGLLGDQRRDAVALLGQLGCAIFLPDAGAAIGLGLSPVGAGLTLLPATLLMLLLSPRTGRWGKEHGGRWPMALGGDRAGAFVCFLLLRPGAAWTAVLPGAVLLGLGLSLAVAPLTVVVLDSVRSERAGIAAGVNNAVARLAGLLGVAAVPWAAGLSGLGQRLDPVALTQGFHRATLICAGLCVAASVASMVWIPSVARNGASPARA